MLHAVNLKRALLLVLIATLGGAGLVLPVAAQTGTAASSLESVVSSWAESKIVVAVRPPGGRDIINARNSGGIPAEVPIASLSKAVTGLAIAVLIEEGRVRLDDTVGELLEKYFLDRGQRIDSSLQAITVRRLLTHTAGLRPNNASGAPNAIDNRTVFLRMRPGDPFDYVIAADAAQSSGATQFLYSNVSFAVLGFIIEAVSNQTYEEFCKTRVLAPAGITEARLAFKHRGLAAWAGWQMPVRDLVKLWDQFDVERSVILKPRTAKELFRSPLAAPISEDGRTHYSSGTYVRRNQQASAFVLTHDGLSNFFPEESSYGSYVEARSNGTTIALVSTPPLSGPKRRLLMQQLRSSLSTGRTSESE